MEKIKISSCTGGFRHLSLENTFSSLKKMGFKYVEGTTDGRAHLYPYIFGQKNPEGLKRLLAKYNLKLVAVSGGWSDFAVADKYLEKQYQSLRKQLVFCQKFGVKILRIFASHLPGQYIDQDIIKRVIKNLKRIIPEAKKHNVYLAMENHYGVTATADDLLKIIEGVASPYLKVNFDAANFVPMKENPIKACQKLLPHITHLHLKDIRQVGETIEDAYLTGRGIHEGYELCEIGQGLINYQRILSLLIKNYYQGYYSIEYENFPDIERGTRASLKNLKKLFSQI